MKTTAPSRPRRAPSRAKAALAGVLCLAAVGLYAWQFGLLDSGPQPARELTAKEKGDLDESRRIAAQQQLRQDVTKAGN